MYAKNGLIVKWAHGWITEKQNELRRKNQFNYNQI